MDFDAISPVLMEKVKTCKTPEEIMALAADEGYTLSEDELTAVVAGADWTRCDEFRDINPRCQVDLSPFDL